jgi:hypothetical protein
MRDPLPPKLLLHGNITYTCSKASIGVMLYCEVTNTISKDKSY